MKSHLGMDDYEIVAERQSIAEECHVTVNKNFAENLQFAVEEFVKLHRNERHQDRSVTYPANDEEMHHFYHREGRDTYEM